VTEIDIVIRSYHRDQRWLALALRSIGLYVTGHRRVVVVVPKASLPRMTIAELAAPGVRLRICRDYENDYLGQQITKLHADRHTDAELIVHLDSDQVFLAPCDLRARLLDGTRPRLAFGTADRRPAGDGWLRCPEVFFGQPLDRDLTLPPPVIMRRQVYSALRAYCRRRHERSLAGYAAATAPDRFCEFALLRGFVLLSQPDGYSWVDAELLPECRTFWSRAQTPRAVAHQLPAALVS
jgi:hypothetical protein